MHLKPYCNTQKKDFDVFYHKIHQSLQELNCKPISLVLGNNVHEGFNHHVKSCHLTQVQMDYLNSIRHRQSDTIIATEIVKMFTTYRYKIDDSVTEKIMGDWVNDLMSYPAWAVVQAFTEWRRFSVYRPKPADIIKIIIRNIKEVDDFFRSSGNVKYASESTENFFQEIIISSLGVNIYKAWFTKCEYNFNESEIKIIPPSKFIEKYIRENYLGVLEEVINEKNINKKITLSSQEFSFY